MSNLPEYRIKASLLVRNLIKFFDYLQDNYLLYLLMYLVGSFLVDLNEKGKSGEQLIKIGHTQDVLNRETRSHYC